MNESMDQITLNTHMYITLKERPGSSLVTIYQMLAVIVPFYVEFEENTVHAITHVMVDGPTYYLIHA